MSWRARAMLSEVGVAVNDESAFAAKTYPDLSGTVVFNHEIINLSNARVHICQVVKHIFEIELID
jgi:hypothetical protein